MIEYVNSSGSPTCHIESNRPSAPNLFTELNRFIKMLSDTIILLYCIHFTGSIKLIPKWPIRANDLFGPIEPNRHLASTHSIGSNHSVGPNKLVMDQLVTYWTGKKGTLDS